MDKTIPKTSQEMALKKTSIYLVMAFILLAQVYAIGIAPGSLDVDAGSDRKETFYIINNEHRDFRVQLFVQGDLSRYVELPQGIIEIKAGEETKTFPVTFKDSGANTPGRHEILIVVMEIPEGTADENTIVTRQAIISKVNINVPYEEKAAEADLVVHNAKYGEPIDFVVKIKNLGQENILKASSRIEIYSPTNEILASLTSDSKPIEPTKMRELVARYNDNVLQEGRYYAKAIVDYDGEEITIEKTFLIGELMIELKNVIVKNFKFGEIADFNIIIESRWNEKIPDVYADMFIKDENGRLETKYTTSSIEIDSGAQETLNAYWDTKTAKIGRYDAKITLHFLGNNLEKDIVLDVNKDSIGIGFSPTGQVIGLETVNTKKDAFIIFIVIISLFINVVIFILFMRRRKSKD